MKIDRTQYPIIGQVEKGQFNLPLSQDERNLFSPCLQRARKIVKSYPTVEYLCLNQIDEVLATNKTVSIEPPDDMQGVLLVMGLSFIYRAKGCQGEDGKMDVFIYDGKTLIMHCDVVFMSQGTGIGFRTHVFTETEVVMMIDFLLRYLMFKKHVNLVEKTISTRKNRTSQTSTGTVETDFRYPINVIDSFYYTSFLKGESFPVKGHRRHYKSGKVVDINSFEKKGYTRKAKKLSMVA